MDKGNALPKILTRGRPSKLRTMVGASGYPGYVIAAMAAIEPATFSRYLNRHKKISPAHMIRLCDTLGCEPEDLLEDDEFE